MVNLANRQHIRNWFALGCGLFGIWELLRAADYAMGAFDIITGWYRLQLEPRLLRYFTFLAIFFLPSGFSEVQQSSRPFGIRTRRTRSLIKTILILKRQPPNQSMKPTAPFWNTFSVFATALCRASAF